MKEKWRTIELECWNYKLSVVGGLRKTVSINTKRYCESDCESNCCPLHNSPNIDKVVKNE